MKKWVAVSLSVVLVLISVFSVSLLSVVAESNDTGSESLEDTVVMPKYVDSVGNEFYLYHTAKSIPASVMTHASALTVKVAKNSSNLPFTALFDISGGNNEVSNVTISTEPKKVGDFAGFMFYVEAPVNDVPYKYTYIKDDAPTEVETTDFHLALYFPIYDADKDTNTYVSEYSGPRVYTLAVDGSSWEKQDVNGYGIDVASGFKGYVYVPFKSFTAFGQEDELNGIYINQITANSNYNNGAAGYLLKGYIAEGKSLKVSAPVMVKGQVGSTTPPDDSYVVIEGEKYYYNSGKPVDVSSLSFPSITTGVIKTDMSTTSNEANAFSLNSDLGTRSDCYGLSALTDNVGTSIAGRRQDSIDDYRQFTNKFDAEYTFSETIKLNKGGFIFYAELPSDAGDHEIHFRRTYADGTVNLTQAIDVTWYRLENGSSEWVSSETSSDLNSAYTLDFNDCDASTGKSPAWSGYIYFPYDFFRMLSTNDELVEFGIGSKVYRTFNANDEYSVFPLEEPVKFSAVTHVTEFDPNTTLAYGDGGRLVDLATGEYIYAKDYSAPDCLIGNADLVKAGKPANVLQMEYISDARMNSTVIELGNSQAYSKINADGKPNGKLVSSGAVIKHPAIELSKSNDTGHELEMVGINIPAIYTEDGDGIIFYVKNDSGTVLNFSLYTYGEAYMPNAETGEPKKVFSGIMHFIGEEYKLLGSDGKWQSLRGNGYIMPIPANFEGYFYLDFSTMPEIGSYEKNKGTCLNNSICALVREQTALTDGTFTISYPMLVTNFTEKNAGIAFANKATASQNLFTGDFEIQNDPEGDLNVGLCELVRAKGASDFEAFRNDFVRYYMNDKIVIEPCRRHPSYYDKKCTVCGAEIDVTGTLGNVMIMGDSISTYNGYSYGYENGIDYPYHNQHWYGGDQDDTDLESVQQTWWDMLISNMDANLIYNRSCSGSTIAEATWKGGDLLENKYNSFNERLDQVLERNELGFFGYDPEQIDTFIFFGGTNDNNYANMTVQPKYSDWTEDDLKYFAPAYCRYIATIQAEFPNAKIVSLVDTTLTQVATTQIEINKHYGITTVTINGFAEVEPHPTVKGMIQIEEALRIALSE